MIIAAACGGIEFSRFVTFRIEGGSVKERQEVMVMPGGAAALVRQLVGLEVDLLLLHHVHPDLEAALAEGGVAHLSGADLPPDAAVAAYLSGSYFFSREKK